MSTIKNTGYPSTGIHSTTRCCVSACGQDQMVGILTLVSHLQPLLTCQLITPMFVSSNVTNRAWRVQRPLHTIWENFRSWFMKSDNFPQVKRKGGIDCGTINVYNLTKHTLLLSDLTKRCQGTVWHVSKQEITSQRCWGVKSGAKSLWK